MFSSRDKSTLSYIQTIAMTNYMLFAVEGKQNSKRRKNGAERY